jgi:dGTPase
MITREEIEEQEEKNLAPYAMKSRDSRGRMYPEKEHPYRTCFQRDRDRIVHCGAFRKLEYKTQVFVNHEGDYYRTRLTHTLEVSQISRSISRTLRLNEDLTEAVALAHDLGHTPFGHSGETVLHDLMKKYGGSFEHNSQSLKIVDKLERRYQDFPGLNLTFEVREGIIKHKTSFDQPEVKGFDPDKSPTLEAQVVNVADEIAYTAHDVDDGLTSGYLSEDDLKKLSIWKQVSSGLKNKFDRETYKYQLVRMLINRQASDLTENMAANIKKKKIDSVRGVRNAQTAAAFSPGMQKMNSELKEFLFAKLYNHYMVKRMVDKAGKFISELFDAYLKRPGILPPEEQSKISACRKNRKEEARAICDYIAGMTDRSVQDEYIKLFMPYEKV